MRSIIFCSLFIPLLFVNTDGFYAGHIIPDVKAFHNSFWSRNRGNLLLFKSSPENIRNTPLHALQCLNGQNKREYIIPAPENSAVENIIIPQDISSIIPLPEAMYLYGNLTSMSKARKLIRRGQVFLNHNKQTCQDTVKGGDELEIREAEPLIARRKGAPLRGVKKITIVYEDNALAVIVKPAGVAVHGTGAYSLVDRYKEFLFRPTDLTPQEEEDLLEKPVHAHRLDAPVGGLLIVCKSKMALRALTEAFEARQIKKKYHAIVLGRPEQLQGRITEPIDGKETSTEYLVVNSTRSGTYGWLSQVDLFPETGRKHQLRIACQLLGTPILGDLRYGPESTLRSRGLFLWAQELHFQHPLTQEPLSFSVPLPEIFANTLNMERRKAQESSEGETSID